MQEDRIVSIPIEALLFNPENEILFGRKASWEKSKEARKVKPGTEITAVSDDEDMALLDSIRQVGQLQPIIVKTAGGGKYEIISGHRRVLAMTELKYKNVNAIISDTEEDNHSVTEKDTIKLITSNTSIKKASKNYQYAQAVKLRKAYRGLKKTATREEKNTVYFGKVSYLVGKAMGINESTVKRLFIIEDYLDDEKKELFKSGKIEYGTALAEAKDKRRILMREAEEKAAKLLENRESEEEKQRQERENEMKLLLKSQEDILREARQTDEAEAEELESFVLGEMANKSLTEDSGINFNQIYTAAFNSLKAEAAKKKLEDYFAPSADNGFLIWNSLRKNEQLIYLLALERREPKLRELVQLTRGSTENRGITLSVRGDYFPWDSGDESLKLFLEEFPQKLSDYIQKAALTADA